MVRKTLRIVRRSGARRYPGLKRVASYTKQADHRVVDIWHLRISISLGREEGLAWGGNKGQRDGQLYLEILNNSDQAVELSKVTYPRKHTVTHLDSSHEFLMLTRRIDNAA